MTYEVAFQRVPHLIGQPLFIVGDKVFERPFVITEVTERIVRCKNDVEEFTLTRTRIASLYMCHKLRAYRQPTS